MKTTGTTLMLCCLLLAAQSVQAQSETGLPEQTAKNSGKTSGSLILPDLNPLDLATAQSIATNNNQDVIVVIGARWCAPCQTMKNYVMPQVAQRGGLDRLQFAYVDFDGQNEIATELMDGSIVPQVVYLQRTTGQWKPLAVISQMVDVDKVMELIAWAQSSPTPDTSWTDCPTGISSQNQPVQGNPIGTGGLLHQDYGLQLVDSPTKIGVSNSPRPVLNPGKD